MTFTQVMKNLIPTVDLEELAKQHNLAYTLGFLKKMPEKMNEIFYVDVNGEHESLAFLDKIPDTDKGKIALKLLEEVFIYLTKNQTVRLNEIEKKLYRTQGEVVDANTIYYADKTFRSAGEAIKKDLETTKSFLSMITRLDLRAPYHCDTISDMTFVGGVDVTLEDVYTTTKVVRALIKDIEKQEWKLIRKQSYHEVPLPSKTTIKNLLNNIVNKYHISAGRYHSKQFIDSLKLDQ